MDCRGLLDAKLLERSSVKSEDISDYDLVIFGGGLYASGILGINLVTKNPPKELILFTVGLANPKKRIIRRYWIRICRRTKE